MLGKVFKYQFKSVGKPLAIIDGALLLFTIFIALVVPKTFFSVDTNLGFHISGANAMGGLIILTYVILVIAVIFTTYILLAIRFYRNMFTDEGYLTHTLPVKSGTLLAAHIINFCLWFMITIIAVIASVAILCLGFESGPVLADFISGMLSYYQISGVTVVLLLLQYLMLGAVIAGTMIYVSICIGSLFSQHKVIASIIAYIALYVIIEVISILCLTLSPTMGELFTLANSAYPPISFFTSFLWIEVATVVLAIVFIVASNIITKKHLNLE